MDIQKVFCVYIMASKPNGTLYTGVTSHLRHRVWQHKNKTCGGFTKRYGVARLVYYEIHPTAVDAISHEKRYKA